MRIVLALLVVLGATGCRKCLRSHDEKVVVPGHNETHYLHVRVGKVSTSIPQQVWVAEYTTVRWMCDEYAADK